MAWWVLSWVWRCCARFCLRVMLASATGRGHSERPLLPVFVFVIDLLNIRDWTRLESQLTPLGFIILSCQYVHELLGSNLELLLSQLWSRSHNLPPRLRRLLGSTSSYSDLLSWWIYPSRVFCCRPPPCGSHTRSSCPIGENLFSSYSFGSFQTSPVGSADQPSSATTGHRPGAARCACSSRPCIVASPIQSSHSARSPGYLSPSSACLNYDSYSASPFHDDDHVVEHPLNRAQDSSWNCISSESYNSGRALWQIAASPLASSLAHWWIDTFTHRPLHCIQVEDWQCGWCSRSCSASGSAPSNYSRRLHGFSSCLETCSFLRSFCVEGRASSFCASLSSCLAYFSC